MHEQNYGVYGARKVWLQLRREGIQVARCTVERLMKADGLRGVVRGARSKPRNQTPRLPARRIWWSGSSRAQRPNQLWVVDFERHEAFANPGGGGRPPSDACRSVWEAGGRLITSAWGWLVEQSSTTTSRSSTARWGGLG